MTSPVKFFIDEKGRKMVQMSEAYYYKISGSKKEEKKAGSISPAEKQASDSNLLDTDEQCKRMKNEIRKKFNAKSEVKVEYLI